MPQSLVQVYVHLVFSTKHRRPFLADPIFRDRVHAYLAGIAKKLGCGPMQIGGVDDHVHLLCRWGKTVDFAEAVRDLKRDSTHWIHAERSDLAEFHWQQGYGAFSASPAHVEPLRRYIADQVEHHRSETFQSELRRLCEKYGVAIDEQYVWD